MDSSHILGCSFLLQLLQSPQGLQVLLFCHLTGENVSHYVFFILLHSVQRLTKLEDSHCAVLIAYCCVFSSQYLVTTSDMAYFNASQRSIGHLVREGDLILAIVIVPDI